MPGISPGGMFPRPIIPLRGDEAFDDPAWAFELKLDGFPINGRLLSKQGNRIKPFGRLLETLPWGYIPDGEIVCLDETERPIFNELLFRKREPVYVAFDVLNVEGADVRGMPLKDRRATLDRIAQRYEIQKSELFLGCGKSLFDAVCEFDLEGIDDPYEPERTKWWKILNAEYSQKEGRADLFERRYA